MTFFGTQEIKAQVYAPYNQDYYHLVDRMLIKGDGGVHSSFRPLDRSDIVALAIKNGKRSGADLFNQKYLLRDNWGYVTDSIQTERKQPFLKYFYQQEGAVYSVEEDNFRLQIDPVLHTLIARDSKVEYTPYYNTRGITLRGELDNKIGFYAYLVDNQMRVPSVIEDRLGQQNAFPGEGFWKKGENAEGQYDFFSARGYITFNLTQSIDVQAGYDRNFIGDGYRSLLLSAHANDYLFTRINTKVWKLQYTNLFAKLIADNNKVNDVYPQKYLALHHLSLNVTKNFNIGLFESVMHWGDWEIGYLNPMMFYRALEHDLGDGHSVKIGLDAKWNVFNTLLLYTQLVIDDLKVRDLIQGTGWFANKQALQTGLKYIDVLGIDNLDLQAEYNVVKPYMYSHYLGAEWNDQVYPGAYQHYNQHLAHPLGANFREYIGVLRYQPSALPRLQLRVKGIYALQGKNSNTENWGSDIFLSYSDRVQEYGNYIGQGIQSTYKLGEVNVSYQLFHNFFLDLRHIYRSVSTGEEEASTPMHLSSFGIRWNASQRMIDY
ncbi:hypothetical protein GCM10023331_14690 [Algivirga pacifica]|uniref:Capsule assembly protein Wzi n=1 Tax=Algivirga pacifica TaxID=1162670 RepID=A0ABP9D6Q4_9BACT